MLTMSVFCYNYNLCALHALERFAIICSSIFHLSLTFFANTNFCWFDSLYDHNKKPQRSWSCKLYSLLDERVRYVVESGIYSQYLNADLFFSFYFYHEILVFDLFFLHLSKNSNLNFNSNIYSLLQIIYDLNFHFFRFSRLFAEIWSFERCFESKSFKSANFNN